MNCCNSCYKSTRFEDRKDLYSETVDAGIFKYILRSTNKDTPSRWREGILAFKMEYGFWPTKEYIVQHL